MKKKRGKKASAVVRAVVVQPEPEPSARRADWRTYAVVYLLLIVVTLAVFGQVYRFDFVNYDDDKYVTGNANVNSGLTARNVEWAFTSGYFLNWHPVTWLSHMLDCQLFGLNASGHHLVNVLIHVANALLLFELLRRMTRARGGRDAPWRSALVAALFAIHPVHVQPVAWIASRKDVLSTFFWFLTILCYHFYTQRPSVRRYLPVVVSFAVGIMAKSMLVTLPCTLLLLDFWPLGRFNLENRTRYKSWHGRGLELVIEKAPLFLISVAAGVVASRLMVPGLFPLGARLSNALVSYVIYIRLAAWPLGLAVFHPHPGSAISPWKPVGAALFLLAISVVAVLQYRRRPYLIMGWLWYIGTLLPVIGIIDIAGAHAMAERYAYVPLVGIFIMAVWGAADTLSNWRVPKPALAAASVALVAILAARAAVEVSYWRDSVTLFSRALEVTGVNPVAHNNLGLALAAQGRKEEAVVHFQKAAEELDAILSNPIAHANLASALHDLGRTDEAISQYKKALEIDPNCSEARTNLAAILAEKGDVGAATAGYEEALRANPHNAAAHYNLGVSLAQSGKIEAALEHFREAVQADPGLADAHYNLGVALSATGKVDEAITEYLEAVKLKPNNAGAYINLGAAKALQKKPDEALAFYAEAIELEPSNAKARKEAAEIVAGIEKEGKIDAAISFYQSLVEHSPADVESRMDLARAFVRGRKFQESTQQYLEILKTRPNDKDAYFNLGVVSAAWGKREDAIKYLQKALELDPNDAATRKALARIQQ